MHPESTLPNRQNPAGRPDAISSLSKEREICDVLYILGNVVLHLTTAISSSFLLLSIMSRAVQAADATGQDSSSGYSVRTCSKQPSPKSTAEC